jgi:hypothetical protein
MKNVVDKVLTSLHSSWDIFRQLAFIQEHQLSFADLESMLLYEDSIRAPTMSVITKKKP